MNYLTLASSLIVAFFVARLLFRLLFDGINDFWECVRFAITPDLFSLFRGEFFEDMAKSFKLSLFLILVGASGMLTYHGIDSITGRNEKPPLENHQLTPERESHQGSALPIEAAR